MISDISDIKNGILYFDGCDTTELAKKYGTPLYVISAKMIKDKFAQFQNIQRPEWHTHAKLSALRRC